MILSKVSAGENVPADIYVVIEISSNSNRIKYEVNKENGIIFVDRFIPTSMFYPCNYGFINNTLSLDGDPMDVLIPTPYPLQPGSVIRSRPIGILKMTDEIGEDMKVIAVPHAKISNEYNYIQDLNDFPESLKKQISHFFEHYKDLEKGKWVRIEGWFGKEVAKTEIIASIKRANGN